MKKYLGTIFLIFGFLNLNLPINKVPIHNRIIGKMILSKSGLINLMRNKTTGYTKAAVVIGKPTYSPFFAFFVACNILK